MNSFTQTEDKKCKTCFYCESKKVVDVALAAFLTTCLPETETKESANILGLNEHRIQYKCHLSGKPQEVDPNADWCHQWKIKND